MDIKEYLRDGMTIAISGIDSSYYPKKLVKAIKDSGVKDLTLIYIENNADFDKEGDPIELILNGQVKKLITSHLGYLAKTWQDYLQEVELLPMDVLAFKMQAGANGLPGIVYKKDYTDLYRDGRMAEKYTSFKFKDEEYVMEPSLYADLGIIYADFYDKDSKNCVWDGTAYNCPDVARMSKECIVEYGDTYTSDFDNVDLPGQYVTDAIQSDYETYPKTNWEEE